MNNESISHERLKRATIVLVGILLVFAILLGRIFWIQTIDYNKYLSNVMDQITIQSEVKAERGTIYDKNGQILATNITTYRIFIDPRVIANNQKEADDDGNTVKYAEEISRGLSGILGVSYDEIYNKSQKDSRDQTILKGVDEERTDEVRKFIVEKKYEDMIHIEAMSTRYYPNSELASSVLGFTNYDGDGVYGLESQYDEILAGTNGYYITARDSYGNEMPYEYETYIPAQNGGNLTTTIDSYIQQCLEEQLLATVAECGAQNRACGIVVNVKTGAILAMATVPGFNLNDPWTLNEYYSNFLIEDALVEGSDEYKQAKQDYLMDMWRNKAVSDSYIPGSTFKVVSSSMALTENKVQLENDDVFCGGSLNLFGHTIHCHVLKGHGLLSFAQGLVQSCNVWFMTIGERLGITKFFDYFKSFGYLEKTGIDLPAEGNSVIKSKNDMTELDLAIYAFGQNFNITPIQHIMAIAAVANGGYLLEPYLVEQITDNDGNVTYQHETEVKRQVISQDVCDKLAVILEEGVSGDGGAKNVYVAGYKIAAKTGTSEKKGTEIRVDNVEPYICSCVAFAPADDPEIAVLIMVDEPSQGVLYGSVIAAPHMGALMENILPYIGVEKDVSTDNSVKVPYLMGMPLEDAINQAEDFEYEVIVKGDGDYVTDQMPRGSSVIDRTNKVITLYTGDAEPEATVTVPNLVGKGAFAANQMLVNAKLNICIDGTDNYMSGAGAIVIEQSIPAGTKVAPGTVVTVTFRYLDPDE